MSIPTGGDGIHVCKTEAQIGIGSLFLPGFWLWAVFLGRLHGAMTENFSSSAG